MIQRGGEVVIHMVANVQQTTIKPLIKKTILAGTLIYTDEYNIYARLEQWGYDHKTVNHSIGEYARDEACPELVEGTVMVFMKFTSIQWKVFGRYSVPG